MAALDALGVRPPGAYLWFGRRFTAGADESLTAAISRRLLDDFYWRGAPRPRRRRAPVMRSDEGGTFARALSQANCGRGSWQPGWRVAAIENEDEAEDEVVTVVRPDGLALLAPAADCRVQGALADVRTPKELAGLSPGVVRAVGDVAAPSETEDRVRLSWHVAAAGAVTFVARVTYALNQAGMPFTLELLADPARYGDRPAAGLLLARDDTVAAIALLRPLSRALGQHLSDSAPAFTKPLRPGLALAEEPAGAERFGEHRCRLLAEAVVGAGERGLTTTAERLDAVRERFAADGLSLDAPYLQPGSIDAYDGP
jgi:hypothetical protein